MQTVKVFQSGNSQAIRIPKEYAISDTELFIHKVGSSIILTSKDDVWSSFRNSINNFSDDLFSEGREQPKMQEREEI
ncbi:type II toxin-antitoxin system antitoxin VapB [Alkalispirochaeta sphaeroplastigenens]|uniref:type II toxin-antitoxin system antitoxin VapB n=1 Tax=Alkalispirochaeta sphaeroplastigenens TaxID=1187066 RepID=UPI000CDAE994|nr:type II toxin-antitoxin system VapB family antitoxin [Alkalispirochaeta sphaeroplastigenens]